MKGRLHHLLSMMLILVDMVSMQELTQPKQWENGVKSVDVGDKVTLDCFHQGIMAMHFSWYRQTLGVKPQLLSTFYKYDLKARLYNEFADDPRFSVQGGEGANHLTISGVRPSDSAMYFCGSAHSNVVVFVDGVFLNVKGSNSITMIQQPVSESIQLGESVTLSCTIHTETCVGEHSVYWFRHGSEESHPGILYTHGGRSDQCEKSPEAGSPTQSCVYNLPKRNLSLSDAGTYYCAVASCGEILFGNGTMVNVIQLNRGQITILVFLSIMRTAVLLCTLIILFLIYVKRK